MHEIMYNIITPESDIVINETYNDTSFLYNKLYMYDGLCFKGGICFTTNKCILNYINSGTHLVEVHLPVNDPDFIFRSDYTIHNGLKNVTYRANKVIFKNPKPLDKIETFEFMLKNGADFQNNYQNLLEWCINRGNMTILHWLLKLNIQLSDTNYHDILILCSARKNFDAYKILIDENKNIKNNKYITNLANDWRIEREQGFSEYITEVLNRS
ncbi:ankyrin repeat protein [Megavirus baoshan]|uniref:Putative ankyrin repeat protein n=1 Tax=Megavirus baoshan TaxID=2496520 RepID=A0A3Q8U7I8_9VIRU|nr:ankyrin repeat protein [Megavirus baoshan]AZL89129.1 ankyrin repeat protein [Megavirus baoshan]